MRKWQSSGGVAELMGIRGVNSSSKLKCITRQIEGGGARTHDLRIKSPLLYRLSYAS